MDYNVMNRYLKICTCCIALSSVLTSCNWLGIGGKDDGKGVDGGEVVWRVANERENLIGTKPLISGDMVYFIQDGYLKAYTLEKKNKIWNKRIVQQGRTGGYSHTILESSDKVFLDQGFTIQAHSKSTGHIIWETEVSNSSEEISGIGEPVMSQDEQYLYAGRKGYVLKIRKSDGQVMRRYPLDRLVPDGVNQGSTSPLISPFGDNRLYIPTGYYNQAAETPVAKGNVFSYNATTGDVQWQYELAHRYHVYTLPNGRTDSMRIGTNIYDAEVSEDFIVVLAGSSVIALDRQTGQKVWDTFFSGDQEDGFDVGLAIHKGGVYIASAGWHATKLDLSSGEILWRRNIRFSNTSIPTVQNGRMYFNNSGGGGIWVLDTEDGSVIYNSPPPNHKTDDFDVYISSLGVGSGYMVNAGSKAVYCLKVP